MVVRVRFIGWLLPLMMCISAVWTVIGCSTSDPNPILAFGRIMTDESDLDEDSYEYNPNGHAYVRIINTSDNSVIAETKVNNIQVLPQPYQIRMKYNEAFTDYWAEYAITCEYYNSASDNTVDMRCRQALDIRSYDRKIDLNIR